MIDGTKKMVLVEKASKSGVQTSSFSSWYHLAAYAIRMGAVRGENNESLAAELKEQHLNRFIDIHPSLDEHSLIAEDDRRNAQDHGCEFCSHLNYCVCEY